MRAEQFSSLGKHFWTFYLYVLVSNRDGSQKLDDLFQQTSQKELKIVSLSSSL